MKRILFSLVFALFLIFSYAQDKKMCITVDDLPTVTNGIPGYDFRLQITESLIRIFNEHEIPAIGYVNESKLYRNGTLDSMEVQLLELWLQNGLDLGNHTFSHMNYHRVPFETYTNDILEGEKVIRQLSKKSGMEIRYFRHPYLRSGLRPSHADSLQVFLEDHGYTEAPVTIDNADYLFAAAFSKAYMKNDTSLMARIGRDYVRYMEEKVLFYEQQSLKLFDRNMAQTLLIHANYLNAQYLDELVNMYLSHGYSFVSQMQILKDPAYREEVTKFGDWGISWIDRWALSKGEGSEFFKGDPKTPEYILDLSK